MGRKHWEPATQTRAIIHQVCGIFETFYQTQMTLILLTGLLSVLQTLTVQYSFFWIAGVTKVKCSNAKLWTVEGSVVSVLKYWHSVCVEVLAQCLCWSAGTVSVLKCWHNVCAEVLAQCLCWSTGTMSVLKYWHSVYAEVLAQCLCWSTGTVPVLKYWHNVSAEVLAQCLCWSTGTVSVLKYWHSVT